MSVSLSISRKMLEIEKLNYRRQCCSLVTLLATTTSFTLIALSQLGFMRWLGNGSRNFWVTFDFIAAIMATVSFISGTFLVFYIEMEKKKIRDRIESESRKRGFRSKIEEEKANKKSLDKFSDLLEDSANKIDLFGSTCNLVMQLSALTFLLTNGVALAEMYKVGSFGMSINHIVDFVSNFAYFFSATMFAASHFIMHRKTKEYSKNLERQSKVMLILFVGNLLVFGGKIICAFESIGVITPTALDSGGSFPIGWATRVVGIVLCVIGFCMIMDSTSKKCDELSRIVEGGEDTREVLTMVSTHDVRSCFGYMEYGTR